ncbi:hypothetical protein GH733_009403 [Mirounga leonina]|nr:hypothetical protein GH733_009403 [Mirounga leonina]
MSKGAAFSLRDTGAFTKRAPFLTGSVTHSQICTSAVMALLKTYLRRYLPPGNQELDEILQKSYASTVNLEITQGVA